MRSPVAAAILLAAIPFIALPALAEDVAPGTKFEIRPDALPKPYATDAVANSAGPVARTDAMRPQVPKGMTATLFASGLSGPREMLVLPDRSILVSEPEAGRISRLVAPSPPARARAMPFLTGLDGPYGMTLRRDALYVADLDGLWRVPYTAGDAKAQAKPQRITPDGAFDGGRGHASRNVIWDPASDRFFVAIGSRSNIAEEPAPRATIQAFAADGSGGRTYASGLRNPVGLALQPGTGKLYTVVNERDGLGNGLVPDYLTAVQEGGFYGWPYAYIGQNPQPDLADKQPELVKKAIVPDLLFESHSAPLDLVFYDGSMFPDWRGDALVTLHGSWNRADPIGYMVVRVPFRDGKPAGGYEALATGFRLNRGAGAARVWGRPAGIAVLPDGSILVSDDEGGTIWRIAKGG
ncbi:sorbosone dehydrogenase [Mycobacterium sp. KBS0706]|uniref:PQQ-dependent sugar dehydrogenase n=1 Tax=Mycobacterium sp. KBS0706 TaxID=2578109 RepID=UPI00110FBF03|nr:PQQ-dependent sugar dehydrogenase [Mycobacterium sp. KBS0706]TSD83249.1 sorbosone dehydrogenase [Mycobacterium sp. KBS0706]